VKLEELILCFGAPNRKILNLNREDKNILNSRNKDLHSKYSLAARSGHHSVTLSLSPPLLSSLHSPNPSVGSFLSLLIMDLITTGHLSTDDQEYKLEEGVIEESSSRRIYHRRRRHHSHRDGAKEESKEESIYESKYEAKEDDSSAGVEESKDRDTPRHDFEGDGTLLSPSLRSSLLIQNSPQLSAAAATIYNDTTPSPMLTSSSIRRRPEDKLKKRFSHRLRRAADDIPEVHFIGEICEGVGFNGTYVSCKW